MTYNYSRIYLVLAALLQVIDSLSNINVRIPEFIQTGDSADLTCSFNLGGDDLYSVKWYKGRHEFYRFMPNEKPKIKIFPVKGMKINITASDQTRVVIDDVQINYSGSYMCEVTVSPTFDALIQFANMTVVDFPKDGPKITTIPKGRNEYRVGDTANLMCKAQKSSPPTQLSWYINGEPANEAYLHHYPHRKNGERKLGLKFPLNANHFVISKGNRVRLQCSASISQFYWKSAEITLLQEKPKFASVMTSGDDSVSPEKPEDEPVASTANIGSSSSICFAVLLVAVFAMDCSLKNHILLHGDNSFPFVKLVCLISMTMFLYSLQMLIFVYRSLGHTYVVRTQLVPHQKQLLHHVYHVDAQDDNSVALLPSSS